MADPEAKVYCMVHIRTSYVDIFLMRDDGTEVLLAAAKDMQEGGIVLSPPPIDVYKGDKAVLRHSVTGSLFGQVCIGDVIVNGVGRVGFMFEPGMMRDPNHIGLPPEPSANVLLPRNSPRIAVGLGFLYVNGNDARKNWGDLLYVVQEQYWRRGKDSYSLSPGQTKTVTVLQTSGVTLSTESEQTLNAAVGASISGSYGPFAASLSASLEFGSTHRSQETITMAMEAVTEGRVSNPQSYSVTVFAWELVDLYHLFNDKKHITIENTQSPPLLRLYPLGTPLSCCDDAEERHYPG